jgi:hypothetical protein
MREGGDRESGQIFYHKLIFFLWEVVSCKRLMYLFFIKKMVK